MEYISHSDHMQTRDIENKCTMNKDRIIIIISSSAELTLYVVWQSCLTTMLGMFVFMLYKFKDKVKKRTVWKKEERKLILN